MSKVNGKVSDKWVLLNGCNDGCNDNCNDFRTDLLVTHAAGALVAVADGGTRLEPKIYLRLVRLDSLATLVANLSTVLLILEPNRPQRRRKIDTW